MLAAHQLFELLLDGSRYRSHLSGSDFAPIDLTEGNNLGSGSADEDFVGDIQLVAGDGLFFHFVAEIARESD